MTSLERSGRPAAMQRCMCHHVAQQARASRRTNETHEPDSERPAAQRRTEPRPLGILSSRPWGKSLDIMADNDMWRGPPTCYSHRQMGD